MLIFKCLLFLHYLYFAKSTNLLKCGMNASQNYRKYFVIIKQYCYKPVANSSKVTIITSNRIFTKVPNPTPVFRIVSGSNVVSYVYFINMKDKPGSVIDEGIDFSINFRSILLDEWNNLKPTNMNVTVRDFNDKVVAWIYFKVNENDNITSWFSKDNLKSSFPWKIENLLNYNYNYFSVFGFRDPDKRSFYISTFLNGCSNDMGILCVFDAKDACEDGKNTNYPHIIFVVNSLGQADKWKNKIIGKSLEIMATYNSHTIIYA